jgi:hypothetical protein
MSKLVVSLSLCDENGLRRTEEFPSKGSWDTIAEGIERIRETTGEDATPDLLAAMVEVLKFEFGFAAPGLLKRLYEQSKNEA